MPDRSSGTQIPRCLLLLLVLAVSIACSGEAERASPKSTPRCTPRLVMSPADGAVGESPASGSRGATELAMGRSFVVRGEGFRASCRSKEPMAGLLSVELVQGDQRTLVAQVAAQGEDGSFEVTTASPPTLQIGPAEVEVKPVEGDPPRSAHAVVTVVVEVPGG